LEREHLVLGLDDRVLESVRISRRMRTRWVRSGVSASDAPSAEIAPRPCAAAWTACGARLEPPRAQGRAAVALGRTSGSSARLSAARASPLDKLSTLNSPPHLRFGLGAVGVLFRVGGAALRALELAARLLDGAPSWRLLRLESGLDAQPQGRLERRAERLVSRAEARLVAAAGWAWRPSSPPSLRRDLPPVFFPAGLE